MPSDEDNMQQWVEWLQNGTDEEQFQAAMALRTLAGQAANKQLIREAGGIEVLLGLLDGAADSGLAIVAAETLSCLAADDAANRDTIRRFGGIQKLVNLLAAGPEAECTHRALLALRILTDKEADRLAILKAGGIDLLVGLLAAGPDSEVTEYAAAALGNLAAGSQQLKDAIRQAGGIPPLVRLLRDDPDEIAAELSAVVLRNLALQNATNRTAIVEAGGLQPLLRLLSMGQEKLVYPLACEVVYNDHKDGGMTRKIVAGACCFDPSRGHLCVATRKEGGPFACFASSHMPSPRDRTAERYSLLRKLTITEPDSKTLELNFTVSDKEGAMRVTDAGVRLPAKAKARRLERIMIVPCSATEIKGAIMRMLTRMHLEREFKINREGGQKYGGSVANLTAQIGGLAHTPSMVREQRAAAA
ncbi:hypothetical protein WJX72_012543 [[Myrmecia] bisecta]|uniref:ARM repeat-containing protein n=1 Tax=[Myrmecia] bisecta TaxID=41462 RepID=A0AAW1Q5F6_9CHLO